MISSMIDDSIGKKEFELLSDQEHMEEVWGGCNHAWNNTQMTI